MTWIRFNAFPSFVATAVALGLAFFARSAFSQEEVIDLELQWSENRRDWVSIPIKFDLIDERTGELRLPDEGALGFFRLWIERKVIPPFPAAEGFALIPAGSFKMGDSFNEGLINELPVHSVNLSAYYIGRTGVTKEQWDLVASWAGSNGYPDLPAGGSKGANHPVQMLSWYDAVKWLNAWSEMEGLDPVYRASGAVYRRGISEPVTDFSVHGYRLPTEAEFENAARGGFEGRRFPWGNIASQYQGNYRARLLSYDLSLFNTWTPHPNFDDGNTPFTSPVGSFAPNGYGLYDMAGNLWEWVNDWWEAGYYRISPETDPRGPSFGTQRILRGGGAWNTQTNYIRVSYRYNMDAANKYDSVGFRAARSAPPK